MPRPKSTPTYCIHKRSNRAYTTIDGQQVQLGPANSPDSRTAFDRLLGQWYAAGRRMPQDTAAPADAVRTGPTVAIVLDRFWTHAERYYTRPVTDAQGNPVLNPDGSPKREPTEQLDHFRYVVRPLRRMFAGIPAAEFNCGHLEALREAMTHPRVDLESGKHLPGWCRQHANRQVGRIKQIFGWAVTKGLVPVATHQTLMLLPGLRAGHTEARESKPVRPVDEGRALAVVPHVSVPVGVMIHMQLLCGMRSAEVCIMRPMDVDQTVTPWIYTPRYHKTQHHGIARQIPIGPRAREVLAPFLAARDASSYCFSPIEGEAERNRLKREARLAKGHRVQPSQIERGKLAKRRKRERGPRDRYDKNSYGRAIKYACEKAFNMPAEIRINERDYPARGDSAQVVSAKAKLRREKSLKRSEWHKLNGWHPHQARHRAATDLRKAGNLDVAKVVLGHTSIKMTAVYAEADVAAAHEVIERIG